MTPDEPSVPRSADGSEVAGLRVVVDGGSEGTRWDELLERAALRVLEEERVPTAELSVALLDDADIRRLNREHLDRDRPTDVLAFPLWTDGEPVVGDVYVGLEQARRQAEAEAVPLREELVRLVVHGTLHVLGWDHPDDARRRLASPMFRRQEELVRRVVSEGKG